MTVRELKAFLDTIDDQDMPVICDRYSDYQDEDMPDVREVIRGNHGMWIRYYPDQWPKDKRPQVVRVLHFNGN